MMPPQRRRLSRTIAAAVILDLIVVIGTAAVAARYYADPLIIAGIAVAVAVPLTYLLLRGPLGRMSENLAALTDGIRGFADGDFSLRLRVTGRDEITDLIAFY